MTAKEKKGKRRFGRQQIIPLLLYFLLLWGINASYSFGARYELFMQTLDNLWPVIAFTLLLIIVVFNALLLARRIPLWLLCGLHVVGMALLIAHALSILYKRSHEHGYDHCCGIPWQLLLIPLVLSTLPPLLGAALLQLRKWQLEKAQAADGEAELSFQNASDFLDNGKTEKDADNTHTSAGNDDTRKS